MSSLASRMLSLLALFAVMSLSVLVAAKRGQGGLDPDVPTNSCEVSATWDLAAAKEKAQDVLELIHARYELGTPIGSSFWHATQSMLSSTFDIMKYKYIKKMLAAPGDKEGRTFTMTFGGSSVTAGHDNHFAQSYPQIVQARMSPVLAALGVDLQVHNIAQGANNCAPYQLCYEAMGGLDPDWINWEQSYNCGHDEAIFELAGRVAGWSKNRAVVYYSASGAWSPSGCPPSTDKPPFSDPKWKPMDASLNPWKPEKKEVDAAKATLNAFASKAQSSKRFHTYNDGSHDYSGVSPHGFNVWEPNPLCTGRDKDDTKDITNCNGIDAAQGCKLRFMSHEASVYGSDSGGGANWHPTRAFHMLRGEAIVWLYTLALLDGIIEMQSKAGGGGVAALAEDKRKSLYSEYDAKLAKLQPPIPASPKRCQTYHCEERPVCYTDHLPHWPADMGLKDVIVGKTRWSYEPEEYGEWSLQYGYLDAKPMWFAKGDQGEVHLRIKVGKKVPAVWVCGMVAESLSHNTFFLDENVPADKLKNYSPSDARVAWTGKKYVGNECKEINGLPEGTHVLSVSSAPNKDTELQSGLSHVVMWA